MFCINRIGTGKEVKSKQELLFLKDTSNPISLRSFSSVRIDFKGATCVQQIRSAKDAQDVQQWEQRVSVTTVCIYIRLHSIQQLESKQRTRSLHLRIVR
jgi:hypothetical protein